MFLTEIDHPYLQSSIDSPLKEIQRLLYINRTSRLTYFLVSSLYRAGLSAPFSNPSCLGVFMQRAGSHSTGLVSLSSPPPGRELLLPAPVCSALLSKPPLYKPTLLPTAENKPLEKACSSVLWCFCPMQGQRMFPVVRSASEVDVCHAGSANTHKMSLFQCSALFISGDMLHLFIIYQH